jgi:hypothetical protein
VLLSAAHLGVIYASVFNDDVLVPPGEFPLDDSKRLCVHLLEKAIASLPEGGETLVGIFDLRGFGNRNADLGFVRFLVRIQTECCSAHWRI